MSTGFVVEERQALEDPLVALLGLSELPPLESGDRSTESAAEVGERVRRARKRSGMLAVELAELVGLAPDKLSKVESGQRRIAPREAPAFAQALGVSMGFLVSGEESSPSLALSLRSSGGEGPSIARERAAEILEVESWLRRRGGLEPAPVSPGGAFVRQAATQYLSETPRTRPEAQRQGRQLAGIVRDGLNLGESGIGDLPALVEMHFGVDVVLGPVGDSVAGLCAHSGTQALLLASTDFTMGNVRFTLAHELGHHLLSDPREVIEEGRDDLYSSRYVERRVNSFAAHLLLPESAVRSAVEWIGATGEDLRLATPRGRLTLGYLMAGYGVSLSSTLNQLADLNFLKFEEAQGLRRELSAHDVLSSASQVTPLDASLLTATRDVRVPPRLLTAAMTAARSGAVGTSTVARLLNRPDDDALFAEVMGAPPANSDDISL